MINSCLFFLRLETDGAGPSSTDNSLLIEALVQKGKLDEASTIVKGMLEKGKVPMSRVFRFYISRLPENRVLDTLLSIEQYLSEVHPVGSNLARLARNCLTVSIAIDYRMLRGRSTLRTEWPPLYLPIQQLLPSTWTTILQASRNRPNRMQRRRRSLSVGFWPS